MDSGFRKFVIVFVCICIGILLAITEQALYAQGIIVDKMVDVVTLREIQFAGIFMFTLLGVGLASFD